MGLSVSLSGNLSTGMSVTLTSDGGVAIPANAILYNGAPLTYNGYYLIYTAPPLL